MFAGLRGRLGGDRGFGVPKINAHAMRKLHDALSANGNPGVSTNPTREIGPTAETARPCRSIACPLKEFSGEASIPPC